MRLAVLSSRDSWYLKDLARAAGTRHTITCLPFPRLSAQVTGGRTAVVCGGEDLSAYDAVLVRTMPPGTLEQVVFRMDLLGRLEAAGTTVLNPPRAIEVAVDKFLATARLLEAGVPTPRTIVCQSAVEAASAFEQLGGDVVLKPLFGAEGRGIMRLTDEALCQRACALVERLGGVLYLQEYVAHEGFDLRLFVLGPEVLAMRRRNPLDWRTNVSRGATAEPFHPPIELADLARRAADVVGAPLAGVDLLAGRDGRWYCLEVNAVPGWRALARTLEIDVASRVLDFATGLVCKRGVHPA